MKRLIRLATAFLVTAFVGPFGFLAIADPLLAAQQEKVLYSFSGADGAVPVGVMSLDPTGRLYGTTRNGGSSGSGCGGYRCGAVFRLTSSADGTWTERVLHSFKGGADGSEPLAGLVFDSFGNLYGTTSYGGIAGSGCIVIGCGIVFRLSPTANGKWRETVLHSFNGLDGASPHGNLIFDAAGNLYGTTGTGGVYGMGTVFELRSSAGGGWTETVLHNFNNDGKDGEDPEGGLVFDAAGNLYGTTFAGGAHSFGTAFQLKPGKNTGWTENILHTFNDSGDGYYPNGELIFDQAGNLYGTTDGGGQGGGTAFRLKPGANGQWVETILYKFCSQDFCNDGGYPYGGLIFDSAGNLYGTVPLGANTGCGFLGSCGAVFTLTPGTGSWTETVLYAFINNGQDGNNPEAGLTRDSAGNFYGTTAFGGASGSGCGGYGCGTVFEITP